MSLGGAAAAAATGVAVAAAHGPSRSGQEDRPPEDNMEANIVQTHPMLVSMLEKKMLYSN